MRRSSRFAVCVSASLALLALGACGDDKTKPAVSIDATAPASVAAGATVTVTVSVRGVTLAKADGTSSKTVGHLHVFVDREPTGKGESIPKVDGIIHSAEPAIEVKGLAAGTHTLWVVLGDGLHIPFDPAVRDKVTVTVA